MPDYRRYYLPGFPVFVTCVTHNRKPILKTEIDVNLLRDAFSAAQAKFHFDLLAYAILPDHFHILLQMPEETPVFSQA